MKLSNLGAAALAAALALPALGAPARSRAQPASSLAAPMSAPTPVPALRADQAEALLRMLGEAPSHGFGAEEFPTEDLRAAARAREPGALARLRTEAIAYGRAQHGGRIPASAFDPMWGLKPQPYDARGEFDAALREDRLSAWIAAQPPPFPRYRMLRDGLAIYKRLAAQGGGWKPIPAGAPLALGDTGPRVRALRARLAFEDGILAKAPLDAPFDEAVKASLQYFQTRHGLEPDGGAGARTITALNVSAHTRAEQIRANLERWRWLPREQPPSRLEVNIAAATLDVFQDGKLTDHMLAAAGRPADQTPMLVSAVRSVLFNPAWHVPNTIADRELLPKGSAYLARAGFTVLPPGQGVKLVQKPGPKNSLGQIKFDFPNSYSVYLHDTPSHAAFGRASRSVSHGCVRLERPISLAKRLLADDPDWTAEKIDAVLDGEATTRAPLPQPIAVMLMYWTAFPEGSQLAFRDDVYGWDAKLMRLLAAGEPGQG